ncbi:MAG TPA: DUF1800 domain-containing protein, partial [Phycisphaerales bacterium]|nr:DUF1800 domain-containing protein [Phycisphaerales bacterium]
QMRRLQLWWLERMIETPRPLEEKLTLFWHGHFATSYRSVEDSYNLFLQNQFFRANAAGSFANLVYGIIRDPAMLAYLNNNQNNRAKPNENLARELMELFTLGEGHGYTESDIKNGARALTGFTFDDNDFVFNKNNHDPDDKTIFGQSGNFDGTDFCRLILSKTICSEYLCLKLYRFFVNDLPGTPPKVAQDFILALAHELRESNYALRPMLKKLFTSEHFYNEDNTSSLIKSPVQIVVQTIRSLLTPVRSLDALVSACDYMGQNIFFPPSVKGWDGGRAWINTSTLFVRQNLAVFLLTGRRPDQYEWQSDGKAYDASHLIAHLQSTAASQSQQDYATNVVTYLLRFALGAEPHHDRIAELMQYVESQKFQIDNDTLVALLALIAAMPEFQLC